jgi:hypothetical protein
MNLGEVDYAKGTELICIETVLKWLLRFPFLFFGRNRSTTIEDLHAYSLKPEKS